MDVDAVIRLATAEVAAALAAATRLLDNTGDLLAAATALRTAWYEPALTATALTQASLRRRAAGKFGGDADRMLFTRTSLEQATRPVVARRRATRLAAAGVGRIADLCCGVGSDALAFARAGLTVLAVDSDRTTAATVAANIRALGPGSRSAGRMPPRWICPT